MHVRPLEIHLLQVRPVELRADESGAPEMKPTRVVFTLSTPEDCEDSLESVLRRSLTAVASLAFASGDVGPGAESSCTSTGAFSARVGCSECSRTYAVRISMTGP